MRNRRAGLLTALILVAACLVPEHGDASTPDPRSTPMPHRVPVTTSTGLNLADALTLILIKRRGPKPTAWRDVARMVGLPWQTCHAMHRAAIRFAAPPPPPTIHWSNDVRFATPLIREAS